MNYKENPNSIEKIEDLQIDVEVLQQTVLQLKERVDFLENFISKSNKTRSTEDRCSQNGHTWNNLGDRYECEYCSKSTQIIYDGLK